MSALRDIFLILRGLLRSRDALALENIALRQKWAVLRRTTRRPKLRPRDRLCPPLNRLGSPPPPS